ncbi:hypothetical protein K0U83_06225 [bacterium]|nr:hypothetical protein [bacterium]
MPHVADSADRPLWPVIVAVMADGGIIFLSPPHDEVPISFEFGVELLAECVRNLEWANQPECALGLFFNEECAPIDLAERIRDGDTFPEAVRTMVMGKAALLSLLR